MILQEVNSFLKNAGMFAFYSTKKLLKKDLKGLNRALQPKNIEKIESISFDFNRHKLIYGNSYDQLMKIQSYLYSIFVKNNNQTIYNQIHNQFERCINSKLKLGFEYTKFEEQSIKNCTRQYFDNLFNVVLFNRLKYNRKIFQSYYDQFIRIRSANFQ